MSIDTEILDRVKSVIDDLTIHMHIDDEGDLCVTLKHNGEWISDDFLKLSELVEK